MSRIGKRQIEIPDKTTVTVVDDRVWVKGPLGEIERKYNQAVSIAVDGKTVKVNPVKVTLESQSLWGTYNAHIVNMIKGVNQLFNKKLVIEGIGYKGEVKGDAIVFSLGYSHTISVKIPKGLAVTSEKGVISIKGIDKELVGQFAARIRSLKKPEPYKGKGIRYEGEIIRRKQGKKTA